MSDPTNQSSDLPKEAQLTLERLATRLKSEFSSFVDNNPAQWSVYLSRLNKHFPDLFHILLKLYGHRYDFFYHLEILFDTITKAWIERSNHLKTLDASREAHPDWFQDHKMLGGVCYVDLFADDLEGIRRKIPYFKELGLTYLHLMPLFRSPKGENDGGYAISSYRQINPQLGSIDQLRRVADELRKEGISLVLDFVFNHTSNEHEWAMKARAGDIDYQNYYRMYADRTIPDAYEAHLREIFPEEHAGAFTYFDEIDKWVWTTFHSNQWDLNYANPEVFNRMAGEMLFLANQGVEILRLDAVAFIWKTLGTHCENLPEAHWIIQAYNAIARIASPALLFKSEAIVHPDEVSKYIHHDECQLSYNPLLMALLWNTLATREVNLLHSSMTKRFDIPGNCAWVNYVRSHDDIGWTFSDEDAAALGINAFDHRKFLNDFYTGQFAGSFARGLTFQENPKTQDARVSGTCASLAGLEKALNEETKVEVELAIRRIHLMYNVIFTIGGIPLIYLGDEVGMLNDLSYRDDPAKMDDSRWVHRPQADPARYALREVEDSIPGKIYQGFKQLVKLRKSTPEFSGNPPTFVSIENPHVFAYIRESSDGQILCLNNFSDHPQIISASSIQLFGTGPFKDLVSGVSLIAISDLVMEPFKFMWLRVKG